MPRRRTAALAIRCASLALLGLALTAPPAAAQASSGVLVKCQKAIGKEGTKFVRGKLTLINRCFDKLILCYLKNEKGEMNASQFNDCLAREEGKCGKLFASKLAKLGPRLKDKLDSKCSNVSDITIEDMTAAIAGLGWSELEGHCALLGMVLSTKADIVDCLEKGLSCEAEHQAKQMKPRVDDVFAQAGFMPGGANPFFLQCMSAPTGGGQGLPDTGQTAIYGPGDDGSNTTGCEPNYTDNGNGTVTDHCTALVWQQCTANESGLGCSVGTATRFSWTEALNYCQSLTVAGSNDWRLPNRRELESIVDAGTHDPAINTSYFPSTESLHYWTSTTASESADRAWNVRFRHGHVDKEGKGNMNYVRCVRGGP